MQKLYKGLYVFIFIVSSLFAEDITHIKILPSPYIEVGETVYLDAVYYRELFGAEIQAEWDFNNGYAMRAAESGNPFDTGLSVLHHFMSPGEYNVKLTVSRFDMSANPPVRLEILAIDSIIINVTGEAAISGFELWHAPFHARTAQYLYAVVPPGYNASQVSVTVERTGGGYAEELNGFPEDEKQKFLLNNYLLPAGDYVVTAKLHDGDSVVSRIREKFSKPYDGPPEIGINENNAFIINGRDLFFPVTPYMLNKSGFPLWERLLNSLHTVGWYTEHTFETWDDYVASGNALGLKSIGPSRWKGAPGGVYKRNADPDSIALYVQNVRNTPGLFGWNWWDEPNMGGRYNRIPAQVIAAWSYRTQREDPHHPAGQQYYGYDYLPHYNPRSGNHEYSYMRSASAFGGKKTFTGSFLTYDIYPINYKGHVSLSDPARGVIDLWLEALDNFDWNMGGLIPLGTFIESQNVTNYNRINNLANWSAGPTPGDMRTQLWGSVIHGMKMILYFQFFAPTPADNMSVMAEFKEAVTALTPVILSDPSSRVVSHDANEPGRRVDHMLRETDTDIYIIAARITEPESEWARINEPEIIEVRFDINNTGVTTELFDDFPLYKWEHLVFDSDEAQTDFSFTVPEESIIPGSFIASAVREGVIVEGSPYLRDRWTGNEHPAALDHSGNLKYGFDDGAGKIVPLAPWGDQVITGTINYGTGRVDLHFATGIPEGEGFVQIAYAPANRSAVAIPVEGGIFTDSLERNAVRIYRLPKTAVGTGESSSLPVKFILHQNYPNPFNPATNIRYILTENCHVSITVYDILGREIIKLVDEHKPAGEHTIQWDGRNSASRDVNSGIYFYQLKSGDGYINTKKMLLIR